jgi:DNA-binding NarL/FixJ family response regulator
MIKIAIVDDHQMFRDGISHVLNSSYGYKVIWLADSRATTLEKLKNAIPDILLMDISLGEDNGILLTGEILSLYPSIKVLGLSMHHEDEYILNLLELGAKGYLLKDAGINELKKAVEKIKNGEYFFKQGILNSLIHRINKPKEEQEKSKKLNILTKREIEVLKLVADELTNQEISQKLYISTRTVETHRRNILNKLDLKNSVGLVKYAIQNGYTSS